MSLPVPSHDYAQITTSPPRPDPFDADVLSLLALYTLAHAKLPHRQHVVFEAQEELALRWEAHFEEANLIDVETFRLITKELFEERTWRWGRAMERFFEEDRFLRKYQFCYDHVVKAWADLYKVRPRYKVRSRVAFPVGSGKLFGTVAALDHSRALYLLDPDPRVWRYRHELRAVQRRGRSLVLIPWETVEAKTAELQGLN